MSRLTELKTDLSSAAYQVGGSKGSRQTRIEHVRDLANFIHARGWVHVRETAQVTEKHIHAYIAQAKERGLSSRTLQNRMASVRGVLAYRGKSNFAQSDRISNKALGIAGASRDGTKTAVSPSRANEIEEALAAKDAGAAAAYALQRELGLRSQEAVMSVKSLKAWQQAIERGRPTVAVIHGTKGGRPRDTRIVDREKTLQAVQNALRIARSRGDRLLDKNDLKSAMNSFQYFLKACGAKGIEASHSARYAYARALYDKLMTETPELGHKETLSLVSMSLGHGDGRGTYVEKVYLR